MATATIGQLTLVTSVVGADLIEVEIAASGLSRRITRDNFIGVALSGGGSIATGGFALTVAGNSLINGSLVGNMTGGGTLATGGFALTVGGISAINGSLVGNISGGGTLATGGFTLTVGATSSIAGILAAAGFTLTVPATGVASLLGTAQAYAALKTFSAGIAFGHETLNYYDEGTWTPAVQFGGAAVGLTYSAQIGQYTRIGNTVFAWGTVTLSAVGSSTGSATITGLPFAASNVTSYRPPVILWPGAMTYTGTLTGVVVNNTSTITLTANNGGASAAVTHSAFTTASSIGFLVVYQTT